MATEKTQYIIDLDTKEFVDKILKAKGHLIDLADKDNLSGLISGLTKTVGTVALVGAALFELKKIADTVFDAESIIAVNRQFEILAENAGISAQALKSGLEESAQGLVDNTELLGAANKALIEMGDKADALPELFEAARRVTGVFGGDLVKNFEAINHAIATGQTRQLRSLGIVIDSEAAQIKYARSLNKTVQELTENERKQAILNAVLEKNRNELSKLPDDLKPATKAWQQFKVAMNEVGEVMTLVGEKIWGQGVTDGLSFLRDGVHALTVRLKAQGTGAEATAAKTELLTGKIRDLKVQIIDLEQMQLKSKGAYLFEYSDERINILRNNLKKYQAELSAMPKTPDGPLKTVGKEPAVDENAKNEEIIRESKHQQDLARIKLDRLKLEASLAQDQVTIEKNIEEQKIALHEQTLAKINELEAASKNANGIIDSEAMAKRDELTVQYVDKVRALEEEKNSLITHGLQENLEHSEGVFNQMGAAAALNAKISGDAWVKAGKFGGMAMTSFENAWIKGFQNAGKEGVSVTEQLENAFLGMLGEMATNQGKFMVLDAFSTFPAVKVPELAAGTALIALGGFLGGKSGGGGGAGVGGGGGASSTDAGFGGPERPTTPEVEQRKAVTIQIMGHYFETEQTRTRLTEMIREASDATDFNIIGVGGSA